MTFGEFLISVIKDLLWPPSGIIYAEVQILMQTYALIKVWLMHYGYVLLIGAAIIFAISCAVFGNTRVRFPRPMFNRFFGTLGRLIVNIVFAWIFLFYGAFAGNETNNNGEENARLSYTRRVHTGPIWNVVHSFTRVSVHFHLGRGIFRLFYRLLGFIPRFNQEDDKILRTRRYIARFLAFLVIIWGVWRLPYELTH